MAKKKETTVKISLATFSDEDYKVENLNYIMDTVIDSLVKNIYYVLSIHSVFKVNKVHRRLKSKLVEPNSFEDYKSNLVATMDYLASLDLGYNFVLKSKIKRIRDVSAVRNEFLEIVKEANEFINGAIILRGIKENSNTRDYMKNLNRFSSSMLNNLLRMAQISDVQSVTNEKFGDGFKNIFNDLAEYFKINVELSKMIIDHERQVRKETEKMKKEMSMIYEKRNAIQAEPNEKEILRLKVIKQANEKYEEFCLDFLRDLEKQVPLSTKDMYEAFINEKFAKFQNKFNMPLDNNASEGLAREVIYQIEKMIEYISKISENSYVTSVYSK